MSEVETASSDEELVRAAQQGDSKAFEKLVLRYIGLVYSLAYARLRDRDVVEDLMQEVFLRIQVNLHTLRQPQYFGAWISRLTRNLATDWLRRGQRESRLLPLVPMNDAPEHQMASSEGVREKMQLEEEDRALHEALDRLPIPDREMVLLHYTEGCSFEEVGRRLKVHPTTVARRIRLALGRMKLELQPESMMRPLKVREAAVTQTVVVVAAAAVMSGGSKSAFASAAGGSAQFTALEGMASGISAAAASLAGLLNEVLGALGLGGHVAVGAKSAVAIVAVASMAALGGGGLLVATHNTPAASVASGGLPVLSATEINNNARFVGFWQATVDQLNNGAPRRFVLTFQQEQDGSLSGSMASPDGGVAGIPLVQIETQGDNLTYNCELLDIRFNGSLSTQGQITGNWVQSDRVTPLTFVPVEEMPPFPPKREHTEIAIPAEQLNDYLGQYAIEPRFSIVISREGDHLMQQATRQASTRLYPFAADQFFMNEVDVEYKFIRDVQNKVIALVIDQSGQTRYARKFR